MRIPVCMASLTWLAYPRGGQGICRQRGHPSCLLFSGSIRNIKHRDYATSCLFFWGYLIPITNSFPNQETDLLLEIGTKTNHPTNCLNKTEHPHGDQQHGARDSRGKASSIPPATQCHSLAVSVTSKVSRAPVMPSKVG